MNNLSKVESISINCTIYETFVIGTISQQFSNFTTTPSEITLKIPIDDQLIINSFNCILGAKVLESQVLERKEAEEKYQEAVSKGNTAVVSSQTKVGKNYTLITKLGYLEPNDTAMIEYKFSMQLVPKDLSLNFFLDLARLPRHNDTSVQSIEVSFAAQVVCKSPISRLCTNYDMTKEFSNNRYKCNLTLSPEMLASKNHQPIDILLRTELATEPRLCVQTNNRISVHAATLSFLIDERRYKPSETPDIDWSVRYAEKYRKKIVRQAIGSFIFVLDQSGSMSGSKINQAKEALTVFISSLPAGSQFEIYGFGSSFKKYTPSIQTVNKETVEYYKNVIKGLDATLGGTKFYNPMKSILDTEFDPKLSKNVFLLTDGVADDMKQTLNLFEQNIKNFRIHCVAIGSDIDFNFLNSLSSSTRGKFEHVLDGNQLAGYVINILNVAVQPYYSQVKFTTNLPELFCFSSSTIFYQDEIVDFGVVSEKPIDLSSVEISMTYFDPFTGETTVKKIDVGSNYFELQNGEELSKLVVGNYLRNNNQSNEVSVATQYQVLTDKTALFCVDVNNKEVLPMTKRELNLDSFAEDSKFLSSNPIPMTRSLAKDTFSNSHSINSYGSQSLYANKSIVDTSSCFSSLEKSSENYEKKNKKKSKGALEAVGNFFGGLFGSSCSKPVSKNENRSFAQKSESKNVYKPQTVNLKNECFDNLSCEADDQAMYEYEESFTSSIQQEKRQQVCLPVKQEKTNDGLNGTFFIESISNEGYWELNKENETKICQVLGKIATDVIDNYKNNNKHVVNSILCLFYINQFLESEHDKMMVIIGRCKNFLYNAGVDIELVFEEYGHVCKI